LSASLFLAPGLLLANLTLLFSGGLACDDGAI
jgi:hypothetical protein